MMKSLLTILLLVYLSHSALAANNDRIETDLLGEKTIPGEAYYGVQTARALENFSISGLTINSYPDFIKAWAMVKLAAAKANTDLGIMQPATLHAIEQATEAVMQGDYHDQFVIDLYQGGAGTSTNMNVNEVLANIALEKMGHNKGDYDILSPHDDINMSQSTNDTYPTAIKIAILLQNKPLTTQLTELIKSFRKLGEKYADVVKLGRTEMQDAVPMTVQQEFTAYADALENSLANIGIAQQALYAINMGGTAIGTGLNAPPGYAQKVADYLATMTGYPIAPAHDLIAVTWSLQPFVIYSSALKALAATLTKISNDLILLSSGPRSGLSEINLPARQPGSSIMPGKVNPVIAELTNVVNFRVIGNDVTVTLAAMAGQLQLNAYEPVVAIAIFESQTILTHSIHTLRELAVDGITVNAAVNKKNVASSIGIVTALNPILGYDQTTALAKEALLSNKSVIDLVREKGLLTEAQIDELLSPETVAGQRDQTVSGENGK